MSSAVESTTKRQLRRSGGTSTHARRGSTPREPTPTRRTTDMARTKETSPVATPHWTETEYYLNKDRFQDRVRARNARYHPELFPGVTPSDIPLFPKPSDVALFTSPSDIAL